jgi:hypothetical protein
MIDTPSSDELLVACFGVNHHRLDRADPEDVTQCPEVRSSRRVTSRGVV